MVLENVRTSVAPNLKRDSVTLQKMVKEEQNVVLLFGQDEVPTVIQYKCRRRKHTSISEQEGACAEEQDQI